MSQSYDHHAEDYEDYEGYPDGKDLYDSYIETTMTPSLDEQMNSPEFKMAALSMKVTNLEYIIKRKEEKLRRIMEEVEVFLSNRMDKIQRDIDLVQEAMIKHIYGAPDDYDTQRQIEEELPPEFWQREY